MIWVTGALFLGVKGPGHEADHPPPSCAEVKMRGSVSQLPHASSWRSGYYL